MKNATLCLALFFFLISHHIQAQEVPIVKKCVDCILEGKVMDQSTGAPILFGSVAVYQRGVIVKGGETDLEGNYKIQLDSTGVYDVVALYVGFSETRIENVEIRDQKPTKLDISISEGVILSEIVICCYKEPKVKLCKTSSVSTVTADKISRSPVKTSSLAAKVKGISIRGSRSSSTHYYVDGVKVNGNANGKKKPKAKFNTEDYDKIVENEFRNTSQEPLSTFSIDVDRASYSNIRRMLNFGQMPSPDAVRIEEMVNYFPYNYEQPENNEPFGVFHNLVDCPWNDDRKILHIGIQGEEIDKSELPPSNFVFLVDVSGSMQSPNKLELVKSSLNLLVDNMRSDDKIALVVYAGAAGLVLESTSGDQKHKIKNAINNLRAGGSTAGGAGINLAYKVAKNNFILDGNNRVILATDGDFNIGISSDGGLVRLIEKKRDQDIFLSVLGYGMGNYKDNKMQKLADAGNGNHAYIDDIAEAKKTLVEEMGGTLHTIAKDVKIQIEFNPEYVKEYKLIGYENRLLENEDFNNDKKDAGELGAGHTVTAFYEVVLKSQKGSDAAAVDDLKYQSMTSKNNKTDLATIKLRYKKPKGRKSLKLEKVVSSIISLDAPSEVQFALCVAEFGLLLRGSKEVKNSSFEALRSRTNEFVGSDKKEYRKEFLDLLDKVISLNTESE